MVTEAVKSLHHQCNYGKSEGKDYLMYCRQCVERYMFSKLYDRLFLMYLSKSAETDRLFAERRSLCQKRKGLPLMRLIGVSQKF